MIEIDAFSMLVGAALTLFAALLFALISYVAVELGRQTKRRLAMMRRVAPDPWAKIQSEGAE